MKDMDALEEQIPAWVDGRLVPVGKLEAHQKGLRHKAVSVFVTRGREVLIQQRAAGKYHTPLLWANTCCTHPRWDEEAAACAIRRLREELGITGLYPAFADRVEYYFKEIRGFAYDEVSAVLAAGSIKCHGR